MGRFGGKHEENDGTPIKVTLLRAWNISALATVVLPLLIFIIADWINAENDGGAYNNNQDNANEENDDAAANEEEQEGEGGDDNGEEGRRFLAEYVYNVGGRNRSVLLALVYIWSLFLFAYLVWYGSRVLDKEKKNQLQVLLAAVFFFTNLSFLCSLLIGGLGFTGFVKVAVDEEGEVAAGEGQSWLEEWPDAVMILTFAFWTVFGIAFGGILYSKTRKPNNGKSSSSSVTSSDYQRQEDNDGIL